MSGRTPSRHDRRAPGLPRRVFPALSAAFLLFAWFARDFKRGACSDSLALDGAGGLRLAAGRFADGAVAAVGGAPCRRPLGTAGGYSGDPHRPPVIA